MDITNAKVYDVFAMLAIGALINTEYKLTELFCFVQSQVRTFTLSNSLISMTFYNHTNYVMVLIHGYVIFNNKTPLTPLRPDPRIGFPAFYILSNSKCRVDQSTVRKF